MEPGQDFGHRCLEREGGRSCRAEEGGPDPAWPDGAETPERHHDHHRGDGERKAVAGLELGVGTARLCREQEDQQADDDGDRAGPLAWPGTLMVGDHDDREQEQQLGGEDWLDLREGADLEREELEDRREDKDPHPKEPPRPTQRGEQQANPTSLVLRDLGDLSMLEGGAGGGAEGRAQ